MGFYYGSSFYNSANSMNGRYFAHKAAYGTVNSTSDEKGTDGKKNNTSEYNHEYYMKHKEKWKDKDSSSGSSETDDGEKEFDVDAAAWDVIRGKYGNGQERKDALGDDYEMVQKRVNELWPQVQSQSGSGETSSEEKQNSGKRSFQEAKSDYYSTKPKTEEKNRTSKGKNYSKMLVKDLLN